MSDNTTSVSVGNVADLIGQDDTSNASQADQDASRRVGGSGDPTDEPERDSDFSDDQEASSRVGGSGDPTDEPDTGSDGGGSDFDDDQEASRRVGGSGDPTADPVRERIDFGDGISVTPPTARSTPDPGVDAKDALAIGTAGVVTPEPISTTGGAVLATLAGGALAVDAARQAEIDVPESLTGTRSELDVATGDPIESELDIGRAERAEVRTPDTNRRDAEIGVPTGGGRAEIGVPETQGVFQRQEQRSIDEEITGDEILIPEEPEQDPPSTRERQRRDDLDVFERDFPTGGAAVVGRETDTGSSADATDGSLADGVDEQLLAPSFGVGVGVGSSGLDPVPAVDEDDGEPAGVPTGVDTTARGVARFGGPRVEPGVDDGIGDVEVGGVEVGDTTDTTQPADTGGASGTGTREAVVETVQLREQVANQPATSPAQSPAQAAPDSLLEEPGFQQTTAQAEPVMTSAPSGGSSRRRRRPRRRPDFGGGEESETDLTRGIDDALLEQSTPGLDAVDDDLAGVESFDGP